MNRCTRCVLPETYPGIEFDANGVCNFCLEFSIKEEKYPHQHFKNENELIACLKKYKNLNEKYDVLVPISGGVDSCNVLITIVEKYQLNALAFHNDQGYEDETAAANVKEICKSLNVNLVIMQQDIGFMKKLYKYINEADVQDLTSCYVCGNILYLNALEIADRFDIPLVINGYSKGQTAQINDQDRSVHLLEKLMGIMEKTGDKEFFQQFMDKHSVLEKRIAYRTKEDLEKPVEPGKILFIPFYVFDFYKIDKQILKQKIRKRFDWKPIKTSYPNRTTNCEMIWLNTYMDLQKIGYCNYHIEYAEMVRKGEFTREQALKDLEFKPPPNIIQCLADEVGVDINRFKNKHKKTGVEKRSETPEMEIEFDL